MKGSGIKAILVDIRVKTIKYKNRIAQKEGR